MNWKEFNIIKLRQSDQEKYITAQYSPEQTLPPGESFPLRS